MVIFQELFFKKGQIQKQRYVKNCEHSSMPFPTNIPSLLPKSL